MPCSNVLLCGYTECLAGLPSFEARGVCLNCDVSFGKALTFGVAECAVCLEDAKTVVEYPGCPHKHAFCVGCFTEMVWPQRLYCNQLCGYTDEERDALAAGVDVVPKVSPDCNGDCCNSPRTDRPTIESCPLCRAPLEAPWWRRPSGGK